MELNKAIGHWSQSPAWSLPGRRGNNVAYDVNVMTNDGDNDVTCRRPVDRYVISQKAPLTATGASAAGE